MAQNHSRAQRAKKILRILGLRRRGFGHCRLALLVEKSSVRRPPTSYPAPYCAAGYSLCQTARACKEKKKKCERKIGNCAKKVRKAPGKYHKCLKKWGKGADGVCTSKKAKRKCPASCGMPGC